MFFDDVVLYFAHYLIFIFNFRRTYVDHKIVFFVEHNFMIYVIDKIFWRVFILRTSNTMKKSKNLLNLLKYIKSLFKR